MEEIWKDVVGYEGRYIVSNLGRVVSLVCKGKSLKVLNPLLRSDGYSQIWLSNTNNQRCYSLHRIVAQSFLGMRDHMYQVNHIDGNKLNNCIVNLEWVTPKDNTKHAIATKLRSDYIGAHNPYSKLNDSIVVQIRECYNSGMRVVDIATRFELNYHTVWVVCKHRRWTHLP